MSGIETRLNRMGRDPAQQHGFINPPITRGSTTIYPSVAAIETRSVEYAYGTHGTPIVRSLESAWCELSGAAGTALVPSGLAAVTLALLSFLHAGDVIFVTDSVYRPTRAFCDTVLARIGVTAVYFKPDITGGELRELILASATVSTKAAEAAEGDEIRHQHPRSDNGGDGDDDSGENKKQPRQARKGTARVLFLESPGSQTFEVQDTPALSAVARELGLVSMIDNTWATPLLFDALGRGGCDISIEAATKYVGGHSDILLGIVAANAATFPAIRATYLALGLTPGNEDCFLALRGLRTLYIRLREAGRRALAVAAWLQTRPEVLRVLHPALPGSPGHDIFVRDFSGSSGLFAMVLQPHYTREALVRLLDHMEIFQMGFSWGGFESLLVMYDISDIRVAEGSYRPEGPLLRLQIGSEDLEDIKRDLEKGFARLEGSSE